MEAPAAGAGGARRASVGPADSGDGWLEELFSKYSLDDGTKGRAAGVAAEMGKAGYSAEAAHAVVLGMLHGSKQRLRHAWRVFVPEDAEPQARHHEL